MRARIIDGKAIALQIRQEVKLEVQKLREKGKIPGLAVILVGDDPASQVYVRQKSKACSQAGIHSITDHLTANISQARLLQRIRELNEDTQFHGILVQLPLPKHLNPREVIETVDPRKDVDCFHPYNVGRLIMGLPRFQPATPAGIMELLKRNNIPVAGKHVVILGRSNIVGKPLANMLLQKHPEANAVVTVLHTGTREILDYTKTADILIAAIGRPEFVRGHMIKEGAVVIDVGVNRVEADTPRGYRLVGDVAFAEVAEIASFITPVPGGVGPMTIAMLLKNTLKAFYITEVGEMV